jgi:hypothetical protein
MAVTSKASPMARNRLSMMWREFTDRSGSAGRFMQTYALLVSHYARFRGHRFWTMCGAILINGVLQPIPFLMLAGLIRSAQEGHKEFVLGFQGFTVALSHDAGVTIIFATGVAIILLHYAIARFVQNETLAWQDHVFWHLLSELPRFARWDRTCELGTPLQPARVNGRIITAVRSGFLIGRLIETGLRDAAIATVALCAMLWLDAASVLTLLFISLLFVPVYALAVMQMMRSQVRSMTAARRANQALAGLMRSPLVTEPGRSIDVDQVRPAVRETLGESYNNGLPQLAAMLSVNSVAGIHVFTAFYAVFLFDSSPFTQLPPAKLMFFVVLIVMLRSMQGLIGLISRLSRGYTGLSLLRGLLFAQARGIPLANASEAGAFRLGPLVGAEGEAAHGEMAVSTIGPGDRLHLLLAQPLTSYQMAPLAQVMQPLFDYQRITCRHIPLLTESDVAELGRSTILARGSMALNLEAERVSLRLPLRSAPVDIADAPVIAIPRTALKLLEADPQAMAYAAGRVLVVVVRPQLGATAVPKWAQNGHGLTAVSDGQRIVATGNLSAMFDFFLRESANWAHQTTLVSAEDEEAA